MCVFRSYTVVTDGGLSVAEEKGGIISPVLQNPVSPIAPFIVCIEFVFERLCSAFIHPLKCAGVSSAMTSPQALLTDASAGMDI